ncbi:hypothetical protein [Myroides profundi]|uniref:Uncharacterized protein n=1 Tax=Myroides profundi TaxID=480520 RepID=A0AAJ4W1D1_MYRPR|nr:hypothetical protein [Myroides profundi]AJH13367.1 hypothetical protein MPR_0150 [Myroides profundi]SEQ02443.1 hypothetical protein SAMN04488089_101343 [Myroides profundi]
MKNNWFKDGLDFDNISINPFIPMLAVLCLIVLVAYKCGGENAYTENDRQLKENTLKEFKAVVISQEANKGSRAGSYYILDNDMRFYEREYLYKVIEIGDTLITKQNSTRLEIIKKDTILTIDYLEDIWTAKDRSLRYRH